MPAVIEAEVVRHVARLARLGLGEDEAERMRGELSVILDYVAEIQALDLHDVPPTTHVVEVKNVLRSDDPAPSLSRDDALREAPDVIAGGFGVPRIG